MFDLVKKLIAEFLGTAVLVICGCATAMIIGDPLTIAIAFGVSLLIMYYTIGKVSGCHINPAVTVAMMIKGTTKIVEGICYIIAQIIGAIAGSIFLKYILGTFYDSYIDMFLQGSYLGANTISTSYSTLGIEELIIPGFILEVVLTFIFVLTVCKVSSNPKYAKIGGIVIGFALVLVHILGIPFTGTSVNPARSIGPAVVANFSVEGGIGEVFSSLWVFIVAPLVGGVLAALVSKFVFNDSDEQKEEKVQIEN